MDDKVKSQLAQLYIQKGELITEMEIMQAQLKMVNRQIVEIRNVETQKASPDKKDTQEEEPEDTGKGEV